MPNNTGKTPAVHAGNYHLRQAGGHEIETPEKIRKVFNPICIPITIFLKMTSR